MQDDALMHRDGLKGSNMEISSPVRAEFILYALTLIVQEHYPENS